MTETKRIGKGGYSRQTNSMGDQYTKASLRGAASEKKTQGYQDSPSRFRIRPRAGRILLLPLYWMRLIFGHCKRCVCMLYR